MERFYEELRYGDYDKNQLIIDLINHGARSIDYTSPVIRGTIINGELPNPLNYRDPDNFNPDIIPDGTVTVTLDEIQGANPTVPKKYGIKLLTTLYDNDAHPNINAISWTSDTLRQVNHRVSDQTIYEYLNHFRYFGQSIHGTIFLIHEKTIILSFIISVRIKCKCTVGTWKCSAKLYNFCLPTMVGCGRNDEQWFLYTL
jgi:hypothetical protein